MNRLDQLNTPQMKALYAFKPKISMASDKIYAEVNTKNREQAMRRGQRVLGFRNKVDE